MKTHTKEFFIISIEGNIGVGKTTLLNLLKKQFPQVYYLEEPLDNWLCMNNNPELNILQKFYEEPNRWAYTFQIYAYQSRMISWDKQIQEQLQKRKDNSKLIFVTERSIESAREIFFKMCHASGHINEIEYYAYEQFYSWFMAKYTQFRTDRIIYLSAPPQECLRRIERRGRNEEKCIQLEYLVDLERRHLDWFQRDAHLSINQIDSTINYVTNQDEQYKVVQCVKNVIDSCI